MALASSAVLLYEVTVTRVLGVIVWYHSAFLTVSLAMLGLALPGVWVGRASDGRRRRCEPRAAISLPFSQLIAATKPATRAPIRSQILRCPSGRGPSLKRGAAAASAASWQTDRRFRSVDGVHTGTRHADADFRYSRTTCLGRARDGRCIARRHGAVSQARTPLVLGDERHGERAFQRVGTGPGDDARTGGDHLERGSSVSRCSGAAGLGNFDTSASGRLTYLPAVGRSAARQACARPRPIVAGMRPLRFRKVIASARSGAGSTPTLGQKRTSANGGSRGDRAPEPTVT
jgi:hypothetical protein